MATTFSELKRRVQLGFPKLDGEADLIIEQALNDTVQAIASVQDWDNMLVWEKTLPKTADGTQRYHLVTNLLLTRPKSLYSIILHDDSSSIKLTYVPPRELDDRVPYPCLLYTSPSPRD